MIRKFHRTTAMGAISEINVTSLIDLSFALLIVFMITTPLIEQDQTIPVNLPVAVSEITHENDSVVQNVSVNASGVYFFGQTQVSLAELETRIVALSRQKVQPVIHIRGDREGRYQNVIEIVRLLEKYNLPKVSLDTQPSK